MQRDKVIDILKKNFSVLNNKYDVRHIALFGSVARNVAKKNSDIDVLVEFKKKSTFDGFMNLKFYLEETLHAPVDLVTKNALRPELKAVIQKELINVA